MKRSQIVGLISLVCLFGALALPGLAHAADPPTADGWTWDEAATTSDPTPDGWTWDESTAPSDPAPDGWTWDEAAAASDPSPDGWTWDEAAQPADPAQADPAAGAEAGPQDSVG
jgi:hypothetical protein